jgi:hypothetical protein
MSLRRISPQFVVLYVLIPVLLAALMSHGLWNYPVVPPSVDALASDMWVDSVGYFELYVETDDSGNLVIVPRNALPGEFLYRYNEPPVAIHTYAQQHGQPFITPLDSETLTRITQVVTLLGWELYPDALDAVLKMGAWAGRGFIAQGRGSNETLLLVGMSGWNTDFVESGEFTGDDTYNAYHALFEVKNNGAWSLVDQQYYRFDNSGIEFAQFPFLLIVAYIVYLPVVSVTRLATTMARRHAVAAFPQKPKRADDDSDWMTNEDCAVNGHENTKNRQALQR